MKEKMILSLSILFILGIMIINKNNKKSNSDLSAIQHVQPDLMDDFSLEQINEIIIDEKEDEVSEKTMEIIPPKKSPNTCYLEVNETDSFTFKNAFKYYRNCLSHHENFNWRGKTYTTILDVEKNIHLTDSTKTKNKNEEISEKE